MMMLVSSPSLLIQDLNIEFKLLDSRLSLCHSISWKSQENKLMILKIVSINERILYLPRVLLCLLSNLFINIPLSLEKPTCMLVDLLPFWNAWTIIYYSSNFFLIYLSLKWMDNFFPLQLLPFFFVMDEQFSLTLFCSSYLLNSQNWKISFLSFSVEYWYILR